MVGLAVSLAGTAFVISALAVRVVRRAALAGGFVDRPHDRGTHARIVPLGGGIAINLAIALPLGAGLLIAWAANRWPDAVAVALPDQAGRHVAGVLLRAPAALAVLCGGLVLHAVGLLDDRYELRPSVKLAAQFLVAGFVVLGFDVTAAAFLPPPFGEVLSILWIVAISNAFNLLDNADGLSAGVAVIVGVILAACGMTMEQVFIPALACLVVGAALGFLVHNFPPASIFMGDAGSLPLGYWLGVVSLLTTYYSHAHGGNPWVVLTPAVVMAVPLYDVATVIWIRLRERRPIWVGDRRHFSHRLAARGMSPVKVALTIYLATAATGIGGLLIQMLAPRQTWLVCGHTAMVLLMIALLESNGRQGSQAEKTRAGAAGPNPQPGAAELHPQPGAAGPNPQPGAAGPNPQPGAAELHHQAGVAERRLESGGTHGQETT